MVEIVIAFLVGFAVASAAAFVAVWGDTGPCIPIKEPETKPELDLFGEEIESATALRYKPTVLAIAENVYLSGVEEGIGGRLAPEGVAAYLGRGRATCESAARDMGRTVSCAYADGVEELRDGIARHTGIDDQETLDRAVRAAFGAG